MTKLKPIEQLIWDAKNWDLVRIIFRDGEERVGYFKINNSIISKGKEHVHVSLVPSTEDKAVCPWKGYYKFTTSRLPANTQGYEILRRFRHKNSSDSLQQPKPHNL